jgi:hypothetical protein
MVRQLAATGLASALLLASFALGACGDDHMREGHGGSYGGAGGGYDDPCAGYTSCDTCTPIVGCGWCERSDGTTACLSGPQLCSTYEFRWTWEPAACGLGGDAGPVLDATPVVPDGTPVVDDAAAPDATPDTATASDGGACVAPATGSTSCVQTTGGTLCAATEATVACHLDASGAFTPPAAAAGCRALATTPGADARYYCCPCAK